MLFNIYIMVEDGDSFCIKAKTMAEAVSVCEKSYLEDREEDVPDLYNEKHETEYYHEHVLESCTMIGQLKN